MAKAVERVAPPVDPVRIPLSYKPGHPCMLCNDSGWICSVHRDRPFFGEGRCECDTGSPCICNKVDPQADSRFTVFENE